MMEKGGRRVLADVVFYRGVGRNYCFLCPWVGLVGCVLLALLLFV